MNSPKSTINKIWNRGHAKPDKKNRWEFRKPDGRRKVQVPDTLTIKRRKGGLYQIGNYQPAPLEDVKTYARNMGVQVLTMGAVKIAVK